MGWPVCNSTLEDETIQEQELWEGGLTFHHLGLIISAFFGLIALIVSFYLIFCHATHYLRPREQRHIIRIVFMIPVYAAVSFLSYLYYRHAVYYEVLRDCYEAFAISSFFTLLCHYVAPDLHTQKQYFRGITPKPWLWPLNWFQKWKCCGGQNGIWRTPRSGLTLFNVIWVGVFQYCFIRVTMTIVAVVTQTFDLYCEESLSPAFSHVWVMVIESISVSVAMYCLIQFYYQLRDDISQHKPFLKILSIKLVIFLSFWQDILISLLTSSGAIGETATIKSPDLKVGIPSLLLCIEMSIFAVLHIWSFPWKPYRMEDGTPGPEVPTFPKDVAYQGGPLGVKAMLDAFNPWDLMKAIGRSARWLFVRRKTRTLDPSYQNQNDGSYNMKPTGTPSESPDIILSEPSAPPYGGAAGASGKHGAKYPSSRAEDEEDATLLAHAQANPYLDNSPQNASEIGLALSPVDDRHGPFYDGSSPTSSYPSSSYPPSPYLHAEHELPVQQRGYGYPAAQGRTDSEGTPYDRYRFHSRAAQGQDQQQSAVTSVYPHGSSQQEATPIPMPVPMPSPLRDPYMPPPREDGPRQHDR